MRMFSRTTVLTFLLAVLLFCTAFAIRMYMVDTAPSGVLVDEASMGYNAYSILKTGKDEYAIPHPLVFKAFGDQKLPLYPYLVVPAIRYFGLSALAVRFPSVLAGSFLPVVIFFLLLELKFKKNISFFGGVITVISPWTIILSRFGYESNIGLLFFTLGILFAFISLRKKNIFISILGGIFFGFTLYSYVAYRFITPFIIFSFLFIKNNNDTYITKLKLSFIISFLLMILPLTATVLSPQSTARFNQAGVGTSSGLKMEIDENRTFCSQRLPKVLCYISSNKVFFMARSYIYRYIDVFSPGYLFLTGDNSDTSLNVNNFGLFYVWLLPFYVFGLLVIINRFRNKHLIVIDIFILVGLFVTVTPSLLVGGPHKLRLSALFPFIIIVISYGVSQFEIYFKRKIIRQSLFIGLHIISFLSVCLFLIFFLTIHVQKYEMDYRTYVPKLMKYLGKYNINTQIYIRSISEAIIYYAFVNNIDPTFYQKNVIRNHPDSIGFVHSSDLLNIHITNMNLNIFVCKLINKNADNFYVTNENIKEIPNTAKKIIYSENGVDTLAVIYDLKKVNYDYSLCTKN